MNAITIDADGIEFKVEGHTNGDVKMVVNDGEEVYLSPATAQCLGIALQAIAEKDHGAPVRGPAAFDHLSFGVESLEELGRLKDLLEANDFWASEFIDHGFIISLYSFDPNNIPIEFSYAVPEYDVHSHPIMIDSHPTPAAMEGSEPRPERWRDAVPSDSDRGIYPGEAEAVRAAFIKKT